MKRGFWVFFVTLAAVFFCQQATAQSFGGIYCRTEFECYQLLSIFEPCPGQIVKSCDAPPEPTPTPTPVVALLMARQVPVTFPDPGHPTFWYGGSVALEAGTYTMWVTVNDAILRFTSNDGVSWSGGRRVLEATAAWEDDGRGVDIFDGYQYGVSNASVLKLPCGYVMGYTAGPAKNTETRGGVGLAYSTDGVIWTKDERNPIFSTIGGETYALSAVSVGAINYLYFSTTGTPAGMESGNYRMMLDSAGRPLPVYPEKLHYSDRAYPLAWDASGCWMIEQSDWGAAGPGVGTLYRGGDCFSKLGNEVGIIDRAVSGHAANMLPFLVNRGPDGRFLGGPPFLFYSSGDTWATWQLQAVSFVSRVLRKVIPRGTAAP